jgi:uncharacterized protein YoxC
MSKSDPTQLRWYVENVIIAIVATAMLILIVFVIDWIIKVKAILDGCCVCSC